MVVAQPRHQGVPKRTFVHRLTTKANRWTCYVERLGERQDVGAIHDGIIGELDLLDAPMVGRGIELVIDGDDVTCRGDQDLEVGAVTRQADIRCIQIVEQQDVHVPLVRETHLIINGIRAVAAGIDIGVAASFTVQVVVTLAADEDILLAPDCTGDARKPSPRGFAVPIRITFKQAVRRESRMKGVTHGSMSSV